MTEEKHISVEEYCQLRKEIRSWQIAISLFGLFIFILGGLLIIQGSRYFTLMYASVAVMFGMGRIGVFPMSRIVQTCDKADPSLRKLPLKDVTVPTHYRTKRLLILGSGFLIVLMIFCSQFDFKRGLNKPDRVQTPPVLIDNSTSSLIEDANDAIDAIEEEKSNE